MNKRDRTIWRLDQLRCGCRLREPDLVSNLLIHEAACRDWSNVGCRRITLPPRLQSLAAFAFEPGEMSSTFRALSSSENSWPSNIGARIARASAQGAIDWEDHPN